MPDGTTATDRAQPPATSAAARPGSPGARVRRYPASAPEATPPAAPAPAGRKRLAADQRRAQILEVAIAVFGRRGFRGATTRAIAETAGVSEATIFRHFPSKDDLYVAAFRQRTDVGTGQLVDVLRRHADRQDDEGLLRTLAGAVFLGYERDRDLHRMLLYAWLDQEQAANRRMWEQMRTSPLFGFLERYVARRQAEGVFRPGDPALLSRALLALPVQHAVQTKLYGIGPAACDEEAAESVRAVPARRPARGRPGRAARPGRGVLR